MPWKIRSGLLSDLDPKSEGHSFGINQQFPARAGCPGRPPSVRLFFPAHRLINSPGLPLGSVTFRRTPDFSLIAPRQCRHFLARTTFSRFVAIAPISTPAHVL